MPQQSKLSSFIPELKRRRVFRVAAVYGGVAFVIIQIIDAVVEVGRRHHKGRFPGGLVALAYFSLGLGSVVYGQRRMPPGYARVNFETKYYYVNYNNVNGLDWRGTGRAGLFWGDTEGWIFRETLSFTHSLWLLGRREGLLGGAAGAWYPTYSPGPLIEGEAAMIAAPHDSAYYRPYYLTPDQGEQDADYREWPTNWGAPFDDRGLPRVIGTHTLHVVYNAAHPLFNYDFQEGPVAPWPIEIRETVWVEDRHPRLAQLIFFRYQLFNRGSVDIDRAVIAHWNDFDIIGAGRNHGGWRNEGEYLYLYYLRNSTPGRLPRAATYLLLQGPPVPAPADSAFQFGRWHKGRKNLGPTAASFIIGDSCHGNGCFPYRLSEAWNVLQGRNNDGTPLIHPVTEDTVRFTYDGNPAGFDSNNVIQGTGWLPPRLFDGGAGGLTSAGHFTFEAGDSLEVVWVLVVGIGENLTEALTDLANNVELAKVAWSIGRLELSNPAIEPRRPYRPPVPIFSLLRPYPNPFNESTILRYEIDIAGRYAINAYDLSGRHVAEIMSVNAEIGRYDVTWRPRLQASGIYFLQLTGEGMAQIQKVVYLK